jgi:hypothetical protein
MSQQHTLRLYTDQIPPDETSEFLPKTNRAIYVAEGTAVVRGAGVAASLAQNAAWSGPAPVQIKAGPQGARLLRWELSQDGEVLLTGRNVQSTMTLAGTPHIETGTEYLIRCDRVDFPPGGLALTHTHQGSGIRCLQNGRIRIETQGHNFWVEPGGAWFETGADPVFAETWTESPSHFVRVMILPRRMLGKSSIGYVKPEDQDKPKSQRYQVFLDETIEL